jgi:hypothetical protein
MRKAARPQPSAGARPTVRCRCATSPAKTARSVSGAAEDRAQLRDRKREYASLPCNRRSATSYERFADHPDEIVVRPRGLFVRRRRALPFGAVEIVRAKQRTVVLRLDHSAFEHSPSV